MLSRSTCTSVGQTAFPMKGISFAGPGKSLTPRASLGLQKETVERNINLKLSLVILVSLRKRSMSLPNQTDRFKTEVGKLLYY